MVWKMVDSLAETTAGSLVDQTVVWWVGWKVEMMELIAIFVSS
jgi:hypothetical protein